MPLVPNIGNLDRPVIIKQKTTVNDSYGKPTVTLSEFRRGWASMEQATNTEEFSSDRQTVFSTFKVQTHYMSGITNDMVLYTRDTQESFDIKSVETFGRNMFIEMVVLKIIT